MNSERPAMKWRSVQGVPRLSPNDSWREAPAPRDPVQDQAGTQIDEWMNVKLLQ